MTTARNGVTGGQAGAEPVKTPPLPVDDYSTENLGSVRIARRVLRTVIEEAALSVQGVARLAMNVSQWPHLIGRSLPIHGVALVVRDDVVSIDLYLIAQPDVNLIGVGVAVQEAVGQAVDHILGMRASEINVYVQDVA
ncbi:MAG TPA: Asp23/Gls24 family envelope stress response protein [Ktedonobacterales bacterium]|nr:Asp23/Gls24 family envelope stress response protein [Ktedonobacterales bacterium]